MLKTTITGIPIHVTADRIVVQNGAAVDTYSRDYYRLPLEAERRTREPVTVEWTDPLPVEIVIGSEGHGVLVPIERR